MMQTTNIIGADFGQRRLYFGELGLNPFDPTSYQVANSFYEVGSIINLINYFVKRAMIRDPIRYAAASSSGTNTIAYPLPLRGHMYHPENVKVHLRLRRKVVYYNPTSVVAHLKCLKWCPRYRQKNSIVTDMPVAVWNNDQSTGTAGSATTFFHRPDAAVATFANLGALIKLGELYRRIGWQTITRFPHNTQPFKPQIPEAGGDTTAAANSTTIHYTNTAGGGGAGISDPAGLSYSMYPSVPPGTDVYGQFDTATGGYGAELYDMARFNLKTNPFFRKMFKFCGTLLDKAIPPAGMAAFNWKYSCVPKIWLGNWWSFIPCFASTPTDRYSQLYNNWGADTTTLRALYPSKRIDGWTRYIQSQQLQGGIAFDNAAGGVTQNVPLQYSNCQVCSLDTFYVSGRVSFRGRRPFVGGYYHPSFVLNPSSTLSEYSTVFPTSGAEKKVVTQGPV